MSNGQYVIMNATQDGLDTQPGAIGNPYSIVVSAGFMHNKSYNQIATSFRGTELEFDRLTSLKKIDLAYKEKLFKAAWQVITDDIPVQLTETPDHMSMVIFDPGFRTASNLNASLIYLAKTPLEQVESYSYMIDPEDTNVFVFGQTMGPSFGFTSVAPSIRGTHYFLSDRIKMLGVDQNFLQTVLLSNDLPTLRDSYADLADEIIAIDRVNDEEKIIVESLNEDFKHFDYNTNLVIF